MQVPPVWRCLLAHKSFVILGLFVIHCHQLFYIKKVKCCYESFPPSELLWSLFIKFLNQNNALNSKKHNLFCLVFSGSPFLNLLTCWDLAHWGTLTQNELSVESSGSQRLYWKISVSNVWWSTSDSLKTLRHLKKHRKASCLSWKPIFGLFSV